MRDMLSVSVSTQLPQKNGRLSSDNLLYFFTLFFFIHLFFFLIFIVFFVTITI